MGLVALNGQSKFFEGEPVSISDFNSVQRAIKGTLDNPSLADTKNILHLRNLAKLDMFVPKRTTLPIDAVAFRGFPRATLIDVVLDASIDNAGVSGLLIIQTNNKVGYDIMFNIRMSQDGERGGIKTASATLPAGQTYMYYNFGWEGNYTNINTSTVTVQVQQISPTVYNDNNLPLEVTKTVNKGGTGGTTTYYIREANSFSCGASFIGGEFTVARTSDFAIGENVDFGISVFGYKYYRYGLGSGSYNRVMEIYTRNVRQQDNTFVLTSSVNNIINC